MPQPNKGDTGLEGDMLGWRNAGCLEGWTASGGGALDCSGLQCFPDPFGRLIVVRLTASAGGGARAEGVRV
jgi:hypothetical protein